LRLENKAARHLIVSRSFSSAAHVAAHVRRTIGRALRNADRQGSHFRKLPITHEMA
jgi:hypothetical protein